MRETEGLIQAGLNSNPEQEQQALSAGVHDSAGLLNQSDNMNSGLSYGDQALSSAIRNKYSTPFRMQQQGLDNRIKLDARNAHFEKMLTAHQLASQEAQLNFQKELIKYKQKMAKRQQRQQLVGQTLGLVGAIAGGAMGGPAGAGGGMAAGGAAGTMMSSQE